MKILGSKLNQISYRLSVGSFITLLQKSYSISSVGDYYGEYS